MKRIKVEYAYHYGSSESDGSLEVVVNAIDNDIMIGRKSFAFPIDPRLSRAIFMLNISSIERALSSCAKLESLDVMRKDGTNNKIDRITGKNDKGVDKAWMLSLYRHALRSIFMTLFDNDIDIPSNYTEKEISRYEIKSQHLNSSPLTNISYYFNKTLNKLKVFYYDGPLVDQRS